MDSATLTPPRRPAAPAPDPQEGAAGGRPRRPRPSVRTWERAGLAALALAALVGFVVYPTYPNYDSIYSMLWGRELLDLDQLSFEAYRAPTEHPLAIVVGALLSLLGEGGDRVWVLLCVASFVVLAAGVYALGKTAFTPLVGAAAAGLLVSRFDFPFLAARGYIDIPYLAIVIWAAVLEARRPRRGTLVLAMLTVAGLLRPEAWLLAGLYFLWIAWPLVRREGGFAWPSSWRRLAGWVALTAAGPVIWAATDFAVTGNPLYSLTGTSELAEELGRAKGVEAVPEALWAFLVKLDKFPVVVAGILGLGLAAWLAPRRLAMPGALFAVGVATFAAVGLAGLSVIDRYLLVPSLVVMVLAGVALAGWTMLRPSWLRRAWMAGAVAILVFGIVFTATRVNLSRLDSELTFRGDSHAALQQVLAAPEVRAGLRCGPVSTPNHKLIPDVRWALDLPADRVLARSAEGTTPADLRRGVSIIVHGRQALFSQALVDDTDRAENNLPLPGYTRVATSRYYSAYVNC